MGLDTEKNLVTVNVSAPGKVILHGEHAVVYGKTAIATSVNLRTSIFMKELKENNGEPTIRIILPNINVEEMFSLNSIAEKLSDVPVLEDFGDEFSWRNPDSIDHDKYLDMVEKWLEGNKKNFKDLDDTHRQALKCFVYMYSCLTFSEEKKPIHSVEVTLETKLTIGAGTGSSASCGVAMAGALIQMIKIKSKNPNLKQFSNDEKEIISQWAYNTERITHGNPSGVDNTVCTFGSVVEFRKGDVPIPLNIKLEMRILLVDTKVPRQTKEMIKRVVNLRQWNGTAVDHVMEACDAIAKKGIEILQNLSSDKNKSSTDSNYQHLGELWNMNHCLLSALGVSHAALERIRMAAERYGLSCKLTGAGGGGYAMILVPPSISSSTIDQLSSELVEDGFAVQETNLARAGVQVDYIEREEA